MICMRTDVCGDTNGSDLKTGGIKLSRRKKNAENDENIKIYPDIVPGLSHSILDTQINEIPERGGKTNPDKGGSNIKNNRGWSK